jgi:DNA-binding CsgD family transcriptional regulator
MALVALALAGDPATALIGSARAIAVSRSRGSLLGQGLGLSWRALIDLLAGNVTDAENDGRAALAVFADTGLNGMEPGPIQAIARALVERGALAEAHAILEGLGDAPGCLGAGLRCARARLLIASHRHAEALAELAPLCAQGPGAWRSSEMLPWRSLAATAHLGAGDRDRALELAREEVAEAERFGAPLDHGRALRVRGLAEGGDAGLASLEAAIDVLRAGGVTLELGRALVDRGAALRRARRRADARAPLREGMEIAHGCGATALMEQARVELRAAGARPRRVMRSGIDALTPSERRVAGLAAQGLANVEIAQTLFVTTRTVETHLSGAYRKLGITSRAALPDGL